MKRYWAVFNRKNNRFEIYDSLTNSVVLWYMGASLAHSKLNELNGG